MAPDSRRERGSGAAGTLAATAAKWTWPGSPALLPSLMLWQVVLYWTPVVPFTPAVCRRTLWRFQNCVGFPLCPFTPVFLPSVIWAEESTLVPDTALGTSAVLWTVPGGHSVQIDPPEMSIDGQKGSPLKLTKQAVQGKTTVLEYAVSLHPAEGKRDGCYRLEVMPYASDGDYGLRQRSNSYSRSRSSAMFASRRPCAFSGPPRQ